MIQSTTPMSVTWVLRLNNKSTSNIRSPQLVGYHRCRFSCTFHFNPSTLGHITSPPVLSGVTLPLYTFSYRSYFLCSVQETGTSSYPSNSSLVHVLDFTPINKLHRFIHIFVSASYDLLLQSRNFGCHTYNHLLSSDCR